MPVALPPLSLNHLNLPARDPDALRAWYVDKLGFAAHGPFLWSAGTLLVFVKGTSVGGVVGGAGGDVPLHFGFRLPTLSALNGWCAALRARGVDVGAVEGDASYSTVYVRDPEGNTFELFYEEPPAPAA